MRVGSRSEPAACEGGRGEKVACEVPVVRGIGRGKHDRYSSPTVFLGPFRFCSQTSRQSVRTESEQWHLSAHSTANERPKSVITSVFQMDEWDVYPRSA